ncbi:PTS sugar transporter subunit IIC [Amedibacillus dolichus]|uniref:PTS sugar transporter subunit IIC n=1 Tax=Amedibacillus dolichus TaxID=31971 RepID=UPI00241C870C|nr:PTS transporter subunit EIIC [Amedibacillus dolichus]
MNKLEKFLMPLADVLTKNRVLIAIRDGFLITTPLLIVGSIFLLIANFPIPGWESAIANVLGPDWTEWFTAVSRASFNCTGLLTALGTGYAMAREFGGDKIQGAAVAAVAFFILMPTSHIATDAEGALVEGATVSGLSFDYIGPNGIFMALICAILGVWLFCYAYKKGWTIKMPQGVPPAVMDSFAALVPSAIVMACAFLIRIVFSFTEFGTMQDFIVAILQTPLEGLGDTLGANLLYTFMCSFLWFFGINGPAVANSVYFIGNVLTAKQLMAFEAGQALPYIFTNPFSNFFTNFGGGGSTLSLVILMVTVCKSKRIKQLGRLSIVPGFFGINEPIIFGLPIVLNPIIIIPFIFVPMINLTLSYWATLADIIPRTTGVSLPWTTPIGFSGWLSTGSWKAAVWQIFLLVLGILIYYPFIKTLDKKYLEDEQKAEANAEEAEEDFDFADLDLSNL